MTKGFTVVVKDEFGNEILEGIVQKYTVSAGGACQQSVKFSVNAVQLISMKDDDYAESFLGSLLGVCDHEWAEYQGLEETYVYCEKCGDKK